MPSCGRVLAMLEEAGESGVSTGEFLSAYIGRHGSAISDLRKQGHVIDTVPLDPKQPRGPARYTLRESSTETDGKTPPRSTPVALADDPPLGGEAAGGLFDADQYEQRPGYADREAA